LGYSRALDFFGTIPVVVSAAVAPELIAAAALGATGLLLASIVIATTPR